MRRQTEDAISGLFQRLDQLGLGRSIQYGYRPHLSLSICTRLDTDALRPLLAAFAARTHALPVTLATAATGGGGGGMFASSTGQPSVMVLPIASAVRPSSPTEWHPCLPH